MTVLRTRKIGRCRVLGGPPAYFITLPRPPDMAMWLLSVGYRLDGEDEVNGISVSMNHFYAHSYYCVDVSGAIILFA